MLSTPLLAAFSSQTVAIGAGVGVGIMVVIYFVIRFWLAARSATTGISTQNLDRRNRRALERMNDEDAEDEEDDEPPDELKAVVNSEI